MPPRTIKRFDDDLDGVIAPAIELDVFLERAELPVDARLRC